MDRRIIFLDIDGTLTEPGSNIPPESAVKAVKEAQKNGHLVFLCTGRNYGMLKPLLQYGFDGVIASSGGYIECDGRVIYDCPMTKEQQDKTLRLIHENGVFCTIEGKEGSYTDEGFKEFLKENETAGGNSELLRWREQIEKSLNILPMKEYQGDPIYKIIVMTDSADRLKAPEKALEEEFNFCIQNSDSYGFINGEIVNRKFDKGRAAIRVCEALEISIECSIAFGDSMNDLELMEAAQLSICMENGSESLKAVADEICPAVNEDGIYYSFVKHGLI